MVQAATCAPTVAADPFRLQHTHTHIIPSHPSHSPLPITLTPPSHSPLPITLTPPPHLLHHHTHHTSTARNSALGSRRTLWQKRGKTQAEIHLPQIYAQNTQSKPSHGSITQTSLPHSVLDLLPQYQHSLMRYWTPFALPPPSRKALLQLKAPVPFWAEVLLHHRCHQHSVDHSLLLPVGKVPVWLIHLSLMYEGHTAVGIAGAWGKTKSQECQLSLSNTTACDSPQQCKPHLNRDPPVLSLATKSFAL